MSNEKYYFFERTILDECVSIDIAEKNTRLCPWEAIIRKKEKHHATPAGWIEASTHAKLNSTQLRLIGLGHRHKPQHMFQTRQLSPVGLGHRCGQYTRKRRQKRSIAAAANSLSHLLKSPSRHGPKSIGKREERTAPHREDHRHAGPAAVVPLQHRTSSGRVEPPNLDPTQAALQSPL